MNHIDVSRVDLNLLSAFEALYQERSVSDAARRVYIGQPAMSHALSRLRVLFNDPLMERHGQKMEPTRRAHELYPVIHNVLMEIRERVLNQTRFDASQLEATVRIGLSDYAEMVFARPLFARIKDEAPGSRISFMTVNRSEACELIKSGGLDIALGHWVNVPETVATEKLYQEKHVCLYDQKATGITEPLSLEQYASTPHAMVTMDGVLSSKVDDSLKKAGLTRQVVLGCTRFVALLELLKGQNLVSVVPELLCHLPAAHTDLVHCQPPVAVGDFSIGLAWRKNDGYHPVMQWLKALISTVVLAEREGIYTEQL